MAQLTKIYIGRFYFNAFELLMIRIKYTSSLI